MELLEFLVQTGFKRGKIYKVEKLSSYATLQSRKRHRRKKMEKKEEKRHMF